MIIDLHANREFAKPAEGCVVKNSMHVIYKCPAKKDTIGYGFNIEENELPAEIGKELLARAMKDKRFDKLEKTGYKLQVSYNIKKDGIPEDIAYKLLDINLRNAEAELIDNCRFWRDLDFVRRQVLIDMCFNMGWPTLSNFKKMFAALKDGDYEEAANQMIDSKWYRDVKKRAEYLVESMRTGVWVEYT